ncbi:MAG: sulfite exporter TauE/SafE family protein [Clostridia bacterium]|nr:sulfite exporter TauE/SafE family protein [Clostridia bacterium]
MGLGGGGVLLIYLTVFANTEQMAAQGVNLLFFLPIGLLSVIIYSIKRQIVWKTVLKMWLGGLVGVAAGFLLAKTLDTYYLSKIFASFLVIFGTVGFIKAIKQKRQG